MLLRNLVVIRVGILRPYGRDRALKSFHHLDFDGP